MPTPIPAFVNGSFRESASSALLEARNPSDTSDLVAQVPAGSPADVVAAAEAAAQAWPAWRDLPGPGRADALQRWANVLDARREELAKAMVREVGKPLLEARGEAARAVAILRYYAGEAVRNAGDVIPSQLDGTLQFTLREPLGVVGLVTPWNFPVAIPLWKAAPALAFGNAVVWKPSELSSECARLLCESAAEALPPGVLNMVPGGAAAGEALLAHPLVRAVSFTGSAKVGARVADVCSRRNVRYQAEMGGKNPAIVLADADLGRAAALVAGGAMRFAGQKCTATSRVLVDRKVEEPFLAALVKAVAALPLLPPADAACAVGPLVQRPKVDRVRALVEAERPRVLAGGDAPAGEAFGRGHYLTPTVVCDLSPTSAFLGEELFAPALAVVPVDGVDEAIAAANAVPYGLSAALFTRDLAAALRYVRRVEAGMVRVNGDTTGVDPHAPFGGVKGSSAGGREQGPAAREFYTELRTVQVTP
ncbi:MAG: aldehyde dehydrogenase family protein [Anaeromyxobacteraceae bacterium]